MDTPVEYATTTDGVRIAFARSGDGRTVVYMPPMPLRHVQLEGEFADDARWLARLGRGRRLVRFDPRGHGLSDRDAMPDRLDALVDDLAAVVAEVGDGPVALFAALNSAPVALAYAVARSERVSHLILWCASVRGADGIAPQLETLFDIAHKDWELVTEAAANVIRGWSGGAETRRYAAYLRACVTPEALRALVAMAHATDVTDLLAAVRTRTLVLHRRDATWVGLERSRELASRIAGARLLVLEGALIPPALGDSESVARAVDDLLGDRSSAAHTTPVTPAASLAANAFTLEGEYWTLAFAGTLCRLRDSKGLQHIAELLRQPGAPIAAAELAAPHAPAAADRGDAGPVLDRAARHQYQRRLEDLRDTLAEAERFDDRGRADAARAEIEALTRELAAAVGLGGRERRAGAVSERARVTVTKRIKDALANVQAHHPVLGRHLAGAIKTGHFCVYEPADPVTWSF
jgi:pimeloyl-ACP methyl ester carboxylesterase